MANEFKRPTPEEVARGLFRAGRTPEQFAGMLDVLRSGIENGTLRGRISCYDHKVGFFEMTRRFFVENGEPKMSDGEVGIHEGECNSPICARLGETYWNVLRLSKPEDSPRIAEHLDRLEADLLRGSLREDLVGKPSGLYDVDTDKTLLVAKAVDISALCVPVYDGEEIVLIYTQPKAGIRVEIAIGTSKVGYRVSDENQLMNPDDPLFSMRARRAGIDPRLLREAVFVNAPEAIDPSATS